MDWKTCAWLKRGKRRISVMKLFNENPKPLSATDVKKKCRVAISQASFTLKELEEKNLITCLNPEDKIGRLYKLSKKGQETWQQVE